MLGSPAGGANNQLLNQSALNAQNMAALQHVALLQQLQHQQQLQQQQQLAALYGNSLAGNATSPLANFHSVASTMSTSMPSYSTATSENSSSHNSRKRRLDSNMSNGSGSNSLAAHDSTSLFAATGLLNSTHASGTGGGSSGSAAGQASSAITPIASATTDSAGLAALQNQLLLAAAVLFSIRTNTIIAYLLFFLFYDFSWGDLQDVSKGDKKF